MVQLTAHVSMPGLPVLTTLYKLTQISSKKKWIYCLKPKLISLYGVDLFTFTPEFLNVTVSRLCDRAKFSGVCAIHQNCMRKLKTFAFYPLFFFFFMIHTYYVILGVFFELFLKLKFLPHKKFTFRMSASPLFWNILSGNFEPQSKFPVDQAKI